MTNPDNACPVCGMQSHPIMPLPDASIRACSNCGHEFSVDVVQKVEEIYGPEYFRVDHANWFNTPDTDLFACIHKHISKAGHDAAIIDIGCGTGSLLTYLSQKNYSCLHGIDILPQDLPGITYHQSSIENFTAEQSFDVVLSVANIEHLQDVRQYMATLRSLLVPGGLAVIYTVDNQSLLYRLAKLGHGLGVSFPAKRLYSPHHVNHFSVNSLRRLAQDFGFTPAALTKHNIPLRSVDLPSSSFRPLVKTALALEQLISTVLGMQMLQLAVFVAPGRS